MTDCSKQLRSQLARYFDAETALLFPDGFMAFVALLRNLVQNGDALCVPPDLDEEVWDALEIIQRIRSVTFRVLKTDSLEDLPTNATRVVLVANGISPVTGKLFPVDAWFQRLTELYEKHGVPSLFLLEDSHGVGVLGPHGRGTFEHFGIVPNTAVVPLFAVKDPTDESTASTAAETATSEAASPVKEGFSNSTTLSSKSLKHRKPTAFQTNSKELEKPAAVQAYFSGSFSEAFGTCGGFIVGRRKWLRKVHKAEASCCTPNQFPLSNIVVATKALEMAMAPARRQKLRENIQTLHQSLRELHVEFQGDAETPFVLVKSPHLDWVLQNLEIHGHQVGKTHFTDEEQLRIAVTSAHSPEDIQAFCIDLAQALTKQPPRKPKKESNES